MNQWDNLSDYFNTHADPSKINSGAADNILIAWPSLLRGIKRIQKQGISLRALDYGCGTGSFCENLIRQGYSVTGCDTSALMIESARKNLSDINFYQCNSEELIKLISIPFDLVTSIMVLQFIDNIAEFFANINKVIKSGGVLAFAVFNPAYMTKNSGKGKSFVGFEAFDKADHGFLCLARDTMVPVFMRSLEDYDGQIIPLGYRRIYMDKPEFTADYLSQYKPDGDITFAEYLILVYQKNTL